MSKISEKLAIKPYSDGWVEVKTTVDYKPEYRAYERIDTIPLIIEIVNGELRDSLGRRKR